LYQVTTTAKRMSATAAASRKLPAALSSFSVRYSYISIYLNSRIPNNHHNVNRISLNGSLNEIDLLPAQRSICCLLHERIYEPFIRPIRDWSPLLQPTSSSRPSESKGRAGCRQGQQPSSGGAQDACAGEVVL
jgi:hypothetical protein